MTGPAASNLASARFAAGLLAGSWVDLSSPEDQLGAELDRLLSPQVWWVADRPRLADPSGDLPAEPLCWWRQPDQGALDAAAGRLAAAWDRVATDRQAPTAIRVSVGNPADVAAVRDLGRIAGAPVAASLFGGGGEFSWHCPVRVGTAGARAGELRTELAGLPAFGQYFVLTPASDPQPPDLIFLDTDGQAVSQLPEGGGTLIAIGAHPERELLEGGWRWRNLSVMAAVPGTSLGWWQQVVSLLAGNVPLDAALAMVVPAGIVGGVGGALSATALEISQDYGAGWTGPTVRARFHQPEAAAEAEPPPPAEAGDPRRLVAEFRDGNRKLRSVLPPDRPLTLQVAIAIPGRGQVAGAVAVPLPDVAADVVTLDIIASGEVWAEPQRQQVALPVNDVGEPSTSALFTFTSPASGSALGITINVLYRGRQLQQAVLTAAVREQSVPGERVRILVSRTSTNAQPAALATAAVASWDATGSELRNQLTGASIPLDRVAGALDAFEERLSRTLGVDAAPESLSDPAALGLLVDLARQGSGFAEQLAGLGLEEPGPISLLVQPESRLLPLELAYAGATPRRSGVRLCEHVRQPPPEGESCTRTSSRVVCPYAFWAMNRTIARTVLLPDRRPRPMPAPLDLEPVLFAASARADFGADPKARPSDTLEQACVDLFGAVERVTSWTAWRREVAARAPQLLLLLAHTEVDRGEASLQIGTRSFLARPDITAALVGPAPLVVLIACASAVAGDEFGTLPGSFTAHGAAAVIGMLTKLSGSQGARAGAVTMAALRAAAGVPGGTGLGAALAKARRQLVGQGLLVGMLLVAHGEIDLVVR